MNRDKNIAVFANTLIQSKTVYKYTGIIDNMTAEPTLSKSEKVVLPNIHVTKDDCTVLIDPARGRGILVDSASMKHAGGGVRNGSTAQEEALCRQSNLIMAIDQLEFPLHNKTHGVYIPTVTFFKQGADYKYAPLAEPKTVDVVMLFSRPRNVFKDEDECYEYHVATFKSLIAFSNKYNAEYIILPPIGSGVFKNDPHTIAEALKDVLAEYQLVTVKDVYIACYTKQENYDAYQDVFQQMESGPK
jgi:uncharacterized protein (TIGR02452 family)